jgi:Tol biopolymer transport system component
VYARGSGTSHLAVWVDRDGPETSIKAPTAMYLTPRLSPDGRRLAFFDTTSSGEYDVWILDLERGSVDRLTMDRGWDSEPIWSPDSNRIAYHSGARS